MAAAVAALVTALTLTSGAYGYHRDELYFRMLEPDWGYLDQPPLTPLVVQAMGRLVADEVWAVRIPATVAAAAVVLVLVLLTRELSGGRPAQALCAWGAAFASIPLVFGHVALTSSFDLVVWPAVVLFVVRALLRADPRWWPAAGLVAGLGTYNKLLVVVLLAGIAVGLLAVGPRGVLLSPWVLGSCVLMLVVALPNLVYQATHGWPQLEMGAALAASNAAEVRGSMWWFLLVLLGPPLVPVWVAGGVALLRRPQWRPVRMLVPAFAVVLLQTLVGGTQPYYPVGLLVVLFAAGCVPVADAVARSPRWRRPAVVGLVALNTVVSAVIALPLLPVGVLGDTPVPDLNQVARDQVGWPAYVGQVADVHRGLTAADAARAVVIATNYGEAGAVARYGPALGLPAVYSGHNALHDQAQPPVDAQVVVVVGDQLDTARRLFAECEVMARLDNGVGVDNEEEGQPVSVCRGPTDTWDVLWPAFRHLD